MPGRKQTAEEGFKWSDDEAELLLTVTNEYKVKKMEENIDWESVKTKYEDILKLMKEELPATVQESSDSMKDYPHTKEEMTKKILSTKLKAIRAKFREAVDSGRRSGHGRVVMLYYQLCERIWSGSPATEQISSGIESSDIVTFVSTSSQVNHQITDDEDTILSPCPTSTATDDLQQESSDQSSAISSGESASSDDTVLKRRELLNAKLTEYKHDKLKRKLPVDAQILSCTMEELAVKKRMVEQMDVFEKQYTENITRLFDNMEKLTNTISEGFAMLRNVMATTVPAPYAYPHQFSPPMYSHQPPSLHKSYNESP
uniref:Uncharacterized protein n=1 Tax=Amphimedon queenslandica TaxID=400682 RepID=A0A1X7UY57_AMPQE